MKSLIKDISKIDKRGGRKRGTHSLKHEDEGVGGGGGGLTEEAVSRNVFSRLGLSPSSFLICPLLCDVDWGGGGWGHLNHTSK